MQLFCRTRELSFCQHIVGALLFSRIRQNLLLTTGPGGLRLGGFRLHLGTRCVGIKLRQITSSSKQVNSYLWVIGNLEWAISECGLKRQGFGDGRFAWGACFLVKYLRNRIWPHNRLKQPMHFWKEPDNWASRSKEPSPCTMSRVRLKRPCVSRKIWMI